MVEMSKLLSSEDLAWYKNHAPTSINAAIWSEYEKKGRIRRDLDLYALKRYMIEEISPKMKTFSSLDEKLDFLFSESYYEKKVWDQYTPEFLKKVYDLADSLEFEFPSYSAARQFFATGSMMTLDGATYLERFQDRVVANALFLAHGNEKQALALTVKIMEGEYQPATPTWMNAGRVRRGEFVSCFLLNTDDSLAHIERNLASLAMLSKAGGGVSVCLTNIRAAGAPIQGYANRAANFIHIIKIMERQAAYANQLGTRKGAAVAWWNILHRDTLSILDARMIKYNGDPDFILRTVNLGLVVPDVVMEKAVFNEDICFFDPYDIKRVTGKNWSDIDISEIYDDLVKRDDIRKEFMSARKLFQRVSQLSAQAGQPFILFEGNANKNNPIKGHVGYSNLCSEILQISKLPKINEDLSYEDRGADINCVLGSLGAYKLIHGRDIQGTVDTALRALLSVSEQANFSTVPSLQSGNEEGHPVGLGMMDFAAFLGSEKIRFGSEDSKQFADLLFRVIKFFALSTNCDIAKEKGKTFKGFEESGYADGSHFRSYIETMPRYSKRIEALIEEYDIPVPTPKDWKQLSERIKLHGLYMRYMMAVAPTGSISYVRGVSASIAPVNSIVESRRNGNSGTFFHLAPYVTDETKDYFISAYDVNYRDFIDVYAAATPHVDQGISMSIYEPVGNDSSIWFNHARAYAWNKGIKTIYYTRVNNTASRPDSKNSAFAQIAKKKESVECEACGV